jgi:hypothetical protein
MRLREFVQLIKHLTHEDYIERDEFLKYAIQIGALSPQDEPGSDQRDSKVGFNIRYDRWRADLNKFLMRLGGENSFFLYVDTPNYKIWRVGHRIDYMIMVIMRHATEETCKEETDRYSLSFAKIWMDDEVWHHPTIKDSYQIFRDQLGQIKWIDSYRSFKNLLELNEAWKNQNKDKSEQG